LQKWEQEDAADKRWQEFNLTISRWRRPHGVTIEDIDAAAELLRGRDD